MDIVLVITLAIVWLVTLVFAGAASGKTSGGPSLGPGLGAALAAIIAVIGAAGSIVLGVVLWFLYRVGWPSLVCGGAGAIVAIGIVLRRRRTR